MLLKDTAEQLCRNREERKGVGEGKKTGRKVGRGMHQVVEGAQ
jgi:hypothetical protein